MLSLELSYPGRRVALILGTLGVVSTAACTDDATAPKPARFPSKISAVDNPDLYSGTATPHVIDGKMKGGEYSGAAQIPFKVTLPGNAGVTLATTYVTHDNDYLYLATELDRKSAYHPHDRVSYEFDNDSDGVRENGDDILITSASGAQNVAHPGADFYRYNNGAYNQSDAGGSGSINVVSAFGNTGTKLVFETRQDLNNTDDLHDISVDLTTGTKTIGIQIMVSLEADPVGSLVFSNAVKPSFTTYCTLKIAKTSTSVTCP